MGIVSRLSFVRSSVNWIDEVGGVRWFRDNNHTRKPADSSIVADGFGEDMNEELAIFFLDDMDCHFNNLKC